MKKRLLLTLIIIYSTVVNVFAERWVLIKRLRLDENGSGLYNDITRTEDNVTGMSGQIEGTIINIGCTGPGPNTCPLARPIGGGSINGLDESVANYLEQRMSEVQLLISNGNLNHNETRIVSILMSNGEFKLFRVKEKWNSNEIGDETIELAIEEIDA
jgi:hypothetical protein